MCTAGYHRHRFADHRRVGGCRATCSRCGVPNPNWKKPNGTAGRVVLLVKPVRRPSWWPQDDSGTAWATINWDGEFVVGYSIGQFASEAMSTREVKSAIRAWREDNDYRLWAFSTLLV